MQRYAFFSTRANTYARGLLNGRSEEPETGIKYPNYRRAVSREKVFALSVKMSYICKQSSYK